ncbi:hypothetical protein [Oceanimonas sp. MB9]|uniref:hypothetical protein n=1 Tax=Oceanimonas sp. MB9 TaxID=2588453 RepID=UPI0013F5DE37|nr:hypothetical protein [Oceanimonas sp. MB9]NHH99019.1 hypothetical protein [Oceanimonas sp. MB9]
MIRTAALALLLGLTAAPASTAELDPQTGFIIAPGWETVRNNCIACHSPKLVTQNSGSREHWLSLIRWMQEKQGLWPFDAQTEETILDYLSTAYGPKEGARRPPLRPDQLPENPYRQPTKAQ